MRAAKAERLREGPYVRSTMPHMQRLGIVLAIALLLLVACGGGDPAASRTPVSAANATTAPLLPTDAHALPEFDLAAYERLLEQLDGTPVLVNFWGSWCGPCRAEAAHLAEAHARFGERVQFLGVDILDARESARAFMREFGWTYPSVYDPPGAIRDGLGLLGQPITLFYDRDGSLIDRWVGPIPEDELTQRLRSLVE
jgi:cytochrome c biogenesis protein CcmG/thiol:disulfide interchange protein DsbE